MNKYIKSIFWLFIICLSHFQLNAQTAYKDLALFFSETRPGGTARIQGLAGSSVALGADLGSIYSNPAGVALFQRSRISITPNLNINNSNSNYQNNTVRTLKGNFNFSNIGFAFSDMYDSNIKSDWRGGAFSINYQRTNHFHHKFSYEGKTRKTSIIDYFLDEMEGVTLNEVNNQINNDQPLPNVGVMAFEAFVLDYDSSDNVYYTPAKFNETNQGETVTFNGAQYEWNIAGGANYKDKLYLGFSLGIPRIRYKVNRRYKEKVTNGGNYLNSLTFERNYSVNGTGLNVTLGGIYKFTQQLRMGLSYRTPSFYWLSEESSKSLNATFLSYPDENSESAKQNFDFNLITPSKTKWGLAYFFDKNGFITTELGLINYSKALLSVSDNNSNFNVENEEIQENYQTSLNARIAAEYRINAFRLRSGISRNGFGPAPLKEKFAEYKFTGGIGLHLEDFYIDFTILNRSFSRNYSPYSSKVTKTPIITTNFSSSQFLITTGFKF